MEPCGRLAALGKAAATEGWSVAPFEEHRDTHLFSRRWGEGGLMLGRRASWVWGVVQCVFNQEAASEGWSVAPFEEHRDTHLFSRRWVFGVGDVHARVWVGGCGWVDGSVLINPRTRRVRRWTAPTCRSSCTPSLLRTLCNDICPPSPHPQGGPPAGGQGGREGGLLQAAAPRRLRAGGGVPPGSGERRVGC